MKLTRRHEELLRAMCQTGWGATLLKSGPTMSMTAVRICDKEGKNPGPVMQTTQAVLVLLERNGLVKQTDKWGQGFDADYEVTSQGRSAVFCDFPE